jgi:hypothetical protein
MQQVQPQPFSVIDDIKMNIKSTKKVSSDEYLIFIDDYRLEAFGFPISQPLRQKKRQLLDRNMVLLLNSEILQDTTPDGVYTWVLYKTKNSHIILFSPVETLIEFSNKHSNMNIIAYERGLIPTRMQFDEDYSKNLPKSHILYAGEVKKRNNRLTFNFMSGTYSLKIKTEILKTDMQHLEKNVWFQSLVNILEKLEFPISKCQTSHSTKSFSISPGRKDCIIRFTSRNLISWKTIPFIKENYIHLQPFLNGRFVITDKPKPIGEKIRVHYSAIVMHENLPSKFKGKEPILPKELQHLIFLDEL